MAPPVGGKTSKMAQRDMPSNLTRQKMTTPYGHVTAKNGYIMVQKHVIYSIETWSNVPESIRMRKYSEVFLIGKPFLRNNRQFFSKSSASHISVHNNNIPLSKLD